jgi:hypothetical protein
VQHDGVLMPEPDLVLRADLLHGGDHHPCP